MTKPNHELIAAAHLRRQGFNHYYPRYMAKKPGSDPMIRPLFPRYVFVLIGQVWRSLAGTRGISYVLMGDEGPQTVSDSIINAIKSRENEDGLYQLVAPPKFRPGMTVKCEAGPLAGLPLLYEGMSGAERCRVLAQLLGRSVVVTVEEKLLIAA